MKLCFRVVALVSVGKVPVSSKTSEANRRFDLPLTLPGRIPDWFRPHSTGQPINSTDPGAHYHLTTTLPPEPYQSQGRPNRLRLPGDLDVTDPPHTSDPRG